MKFITLELKFLCNLYFKPRFGGVSSVRMTRTVAQAGQGG